MTSSSSTPTLLHQLPTVAAVAKVSSVAILHFLHCCLLRERSRQSAPDRIFLEFLWYRVGFRASFHYARKWQIFMKWLFLLAWWLHTAAWQDIRYRFEFKGKEINELVVGMWDFNSHSPPKNIGLLPADKADGNTEKRLCISIIATLE